MPPRIKSALFDIAHASVGIQQFLQGKTLEDYRNDLMLRSAVERQLGIIGEAVIRLNKIAPQIAAQISEREAIISFRNILVHGYDQLDDALVWRIVQDKLPKLATEIESLLNLPMDNG